MSFCVIQVDQSRGGEALGSGALSGLGRGFISDSCISGNFGAGRSLIERLQDGDSDELIPALIAELRDLDGGETARQLVHLASGDVLADDLDARALALEILVLARVPAYEPMILKAIERLTVETEPALRFAAVAAASELTEFSRSRADHWVLRLALEEEATTPTGRAARAYLKRWHARSE